LREKRERKRTKGEKKNRKERNRKEENGKGEKYREVTSFRSSCSAKT